MSVVTYNDDGEVATVGVTTAEESAAIHRLTDRDLSAGGPECGWCGGVREVLLGAPVNDWACRRCNGRLIEQAVSR